MFCKFMFINIEYLIKTEAAIPLSAASNVVKKSIVCNIPVTGNGNYSVTPDLNIAISL